MVILDDKHKETISRSKLFEGISKAHLDDALKYLRTRIKTYRKGETIRNLGSVSKVALILEGELRSQYMNDLMNIMTISHMTAGDVFGYTDFCTTEYIVPAEVTAATQAIVAHFDLTPLLEVGEEHELPEYHQRLAGNMILITLEHAAMLNSRIRTIGQKTLRARLKLFLNSLQNDVDGVIEIPFTMTDLAVFINSDRSALYKEIKALKNEGALEWKGRRVRILDNDF